jgi:hypothetical protein
MEYWFKRFFGSLIRQLLIIYLLLASGYLVVSTIRVYSDGFACLYRIDLMIFVLYFLALLMLWLFRDFGAQKN